MRGTFKFSLAMWFTALIYPEQVYSKPMFAPDTQEAVQQSISIVVCEYLAYDTQESIDYFCPPKARYRVLEYVKGSLGPVNEIKVQYDFHDGSACVPPNGFKFIEDQMPEKGSRWILFLKETYPPQWLKSTAKPYWLTYRGDYGRWKATKENLALIKKTLKDLKNRKKKS